MKDYIGISAYYHDSSVALIRDGKLEVFIKEEWLTRIKGTSSFPFNALECLIDEYGVNSNTIEKVCFYEKPLRGWLSLIKYSLEKPVERWRQAANQLRSFWEGPIFFSEELRKIIRLDHDKIVYCEHHLSHALTGLAYTKNQKKWTAIILDGVGDGETASVFSINNNKIDRVWNSKFPTSIGLFYSTITEFLGFEVNDGEYKVMALAAFGEPNFKEFMKKNLLSFNPASGKLASNMSFYEFDKSPERSFSEKLSTHLGGAFTSSLLPSDKNSIEFKRFADIAASAQSLTQDVIEEIVKFSIKLTGCGNIILSGGVAQNCRCMAEIAKLEAIEELVIPPSPGDSGSAIGAAMYPYLIEEKKKLSPPGLYPGPTPSQPNMMDQFFSRHSNSHQMINDVSDLLQKGQIVTTFVGKAETGPRALGNRSILCDGGNIKAVEELNNLVKKRESFRPLAPIMKVDIAPKFFKLSKNAMQNYSWMGLTAEALDNVKVSHPSVLHVDNTARLQTVHKDQKFLWELLSMCEKRGMPILINTSFNISGDPIVYDYVDCYVNMYRMGIEWLVTDDGLYRLNNV